MRWLVAMVTVAIIAVLAIVGLTVGATEHIGQAAIVAISTITVAALSTAGVALRRRVRTAPQRRQ
ncbi:hypothetical protein [Plantactinospora soyae]|uniref:Uncharacterized protein n=1 Tax=Plantactinospora soyae TaxID=1544732 RepID=A0A927M0G0_9ACTN|nr:hypothetical protein [Plantactinospora soyae]MBE1485857.1 hypothetical protein [Plantactinospora soyae]